MFRTVIRIYIDSFKGIPAAIWLIALVLFVNRCGTMVLPFLLLYLTDVLDLKPSTAGALFSLYGLGAIVGSYLGGWLTTKFGSIPIQIIALTLTAPLFCILPHLHTIRSLAVCMILVSVIGEMVRPASATATTQYAPSHLHARSFALNRLAINLGFSFAPAVGGFLYQFHIPLIFYIDAATCIIAAGIIASYFGLRGKKRDHGESAEPAVHGRSPWRDKTYLIALAIQLLTSIVFFQMMSTFPLYLRDQFSFSEQQIGLSLSVNTILIVLFEMVLLRSIASWNILRCIGWGCCLICLGFGILPFGSGVLYCLFTIVVWTFGEMLCLPLFMTFTSSRANSKSRGAYMGLLSMTFSIGHVLGPLIGTSLYEYHTNAPWYGCLFVAGIVWIGYYWLAHRADQEKDV